MRKTASHSEGKEYSHLAVESIHFWQVLWLRFGLNVSLGGIHIPKFYPHCEALRGYSEAELGED